MNRTEPKRETDNWSDNLLTITLKKPNDTNAEASWRRGYVPDCKAGPFPNQINILTEIRCPDNSGTLGEHDNGEHRSAKAHETTFRPLPDTTRRMVSTTVLCHAIRACEREDAVVILDAALSDLSAGAPPPVFMSATDDARWWASLAAPREIKAFAWACFEAMQPNVRASFIQFVNERGAA
jgi:hypothetical protein